MSPDQLIFIKNHLLESNSKKSEFDHSQEKNGVHSDSEAKRGYTSPNKKDKNDPMEKDFKYKIKKETSNRNKKNRISAGNVLPNKNLSLYKSDNSELNKDEVTTLNINSNNIFENENFEIKITRSRHSSAKSSQSYKNKAAPSATVASNNERTVSKRDINNNNNKNKRYRNEVEIKEKENKEEFEKKFSSNFKLSSSIVVLNVNN